MVAMSQVVELSQRIAHQFDPDKIVLFGSYAYGTPADYSDVDLLVIMPFEGHPFDKAMDILNRLDPDFAADVVVRTPKDTARRYAQYDPLIREALDRGRVLYERERS
jgi:predicted nucleotidyltransferase